MGVQEGRGSFWWSEPCEQRQPGMGCLRADKAISSVTDQRAKERRPTREVRSGW